METLVFETPSLLAGKASFSDWEALYRNLWCHAETARHMLWTPTHTEEDARRRMERTLLWQKEHLAFTVYDRASGEAVGFAGVMEIEPGVYEDIGLALGPGFAGRGLGTELLCGLMAHVFDALHAQRLVCSCRAANEASRRLQLRCGLRYTHTEPRTDPRNGEGYPLEFYAIDRAAYEARRGKAGAGHPEK